MAVDPGMPSSPETRRPPSSALVGQVIITGDDRLWGLLAHVVALASGFIGPLIIYILKRKQSPFVAYHAREALNFNISLVVYFAVSLLLAKLMAQFLAVLCVAIPIFGIVMAIIAGLKANQGELYRYPLCIRFIK